VKKPNLPSTLPHGRMTPAAPQFFRWAFADEEDRPSTIKTEHIHWGITAYAELDQENGSMRDSLSVEVEAANEQQAIARAQEIVQRPWYRVTWVREACTADKELKE